MRQITFAQRLRYWFDNSLSRGTASLIGWLAVVTLAVILLSAAILFVTKLQPETEPAPEAVTTETAKDEKPEANDKAADEKADKAADKADKSVDDKNADEAKTEKKEEPAAEAPKTEAAPEGFSYAEAFWQSLMHSLDAGTVAGDSGWVYRLYMLAITIFGIFIVSALIGVLTSGLEAKLEDLRKGKSLVVEEDHTIILGWSSRIFLVISELVKANESAAKPRIVILADKDKVEMEDEIRAKIQDTGNTKVICRSGSPIDLDDLDIVNPQQCKSIIVLSPDDTEDPDSQVIKMILALTNGPNRRAEPYHIVAELRDTENAQVARMVGKDELELVLTNDLVSRITVQTCRQTGLSMVYKELLDFGGDEIYFSSESGLAGRSYGESLSSFDSATVIGIARKDGTNLVNPSNETLIAAGDKLIVIAEDDSKIKLSSVAQTINQTAIVKGVSAEPTAEKILILGWNNRGSKIVEELNNYVASGSELKVVSDFAATGDDVSALSDGLNNLKIEFEQGCISDRRVLDSLDLVQYQYIILLCYSDDLEPQDADSRTLVALLHLRDIERIHGEAYSIVSEMLDVKNRALAEVAKADDFVVSDELAGLLLTQIAENKALGSVFDDLFDSDGSEIYLKPAGEYIKPNETVNFATILESARQRNETALGYRIVAEAASGKGNYGVYINPRKGTNIMLTPEDKIIVLADS